MSANIPLNAVAPAINRAMREAPRPLKATNVMNDNTAGMMMAAFSFKISRMGRISFLNLRFLASEKTRVLEHVRDVSEAKIKE